MNLFLLDVLLLEGETWNGVREVVRRRIAERKKQFRNAEQDKRLKEKAAQSWRALGCMRVLEEIPCSKGNSDNRAFEAGARRHRQQDEARRVAANIPSCRSYCGRLDVRGCSVQQWLVG